MEFDTYYLLNAYVPNSGDGLKRLVTDVVHFSLYFLALCSPEKRHTCSFPVLGFLRIFFCIVFEC